MDLKEQIKRVYVDVENPSPEAQDLVTELEMLTTGSSSGFAHLTNVDLSGQFIVFDVSALAGQIQTFRHDGHSRPDLEPGTCEP